MMTAVGVACLGMLGLVIILSVGDLILALREGWILWRDDVTACTAQPRSQRKALMRNDGTMSINEIRAPEGMPPGRVLLGKVRVSSITDHWHGFYKTVKLEGLPAYRPVKPRREGYPNLGELLTLNVSNPELLEQLKPGVTFRLELLDAEEGLAAELVEDGEGEEPPAK